MAFLNISVDNSIRVQVKSLAVDRRRSNKNMSALVPFAFRAFAIRRVSPLHVAAQRIQRRASVPLFSSAWRLVRSTPCCFHLRIFLFLRSAFSDPCREGTHEFRGKAAPNADFGAWTRCVVRDPSSGDPWKIVSR